MFLETDPTHVGCYPRNGGQTASEVLREGLRLRGAPFYSGSVTRTTRKPRFQSFKAGWLP